MANKITTIGLPEKTWKKTKMYAAKNNMSMAGVIVQATEAFLGLTPNDESVSQEMNEKIDSQKNDARPAGIGRRASKR